MPKEAVKVDVKIVPFTPTLEGHDFPKVDIFVVKVTRNGRLWLETFTDEGKKEDFLTGLRAGASMYDDFSVEVNED
jgi:hypothetical protein